MGDRLGASQDVRGGVTPQLQVYPPHKSGPANSALSCPCRRCVCPLGTTGDGTGSTCTEDTAAEQKGLAEFWNDPKGQACDTGVNIPMPNNSAGWIEDPTGRLGGWWEVACESGSSWSAESMWSVSVPRVGVNPCLTRVYLDLASWAAGPTPCRVL